MSHPIFSSGSFSTRVIRTHQYLLYLPKDYDSTSDTKWPLTLFLHGYGERGTNQLDLVKRNGLPRLITEGKEYPFIAVFPQLYISTFANGWEADVLANLLDEIERKYDVDRNRVYVTGISMGGFGTWDIAITYPGRFAAAIPICGGGNPELVHRIKHLPVWCFHGARDNVVPIQRSIEMITALQKVGGSVKFTVYPDAGHDSWSQTYENDEVIKWMLEQKRKRENLA